MKSFFRILSVIFVATAASFSGQPPHFEIADGSNSPNLPLVSLNFNMDKLEEIGNEFQIIHHLWNKSPSGSDTLDSLVLLSYAKKIRIHSISFSRNDTVYCSADNFPPSDSLKWRLLKTQRDTLKLRGSYMEICHVYQIVGGSISFATIIWHLKKKYDFDGSRDIFTLILSEMPEGLPYSVSVSPQTGFSMRPVNSQRPVKFAVLNGLTTDFHSMGLENHPIFDIAGKVQFGAPSSSLIFISPAGK